MFHTDIIFDPPGENEELKAYLADMTVKLNRLKTSIARTSVGSPSVIVSAKAAAAGGGAGELVGISIENTSGSQVGIAEILRFVESAFGKITWTITNDFVHKRVIVQPSDPDDVTIAMLDTVTAFQAVTGDAHEADSTDVTQAAKVIGVSLQSITAGFSGQIRTIGTLFNPLWTWTKGDRIFLNGITLSTTPPSIGFVKMLGVAIDQFTITLQHNPSVLL